MKSHELANELAKLAEHLKAQEDVEIGTPYIRNFCISDTTTFRNFVRVLPRPLKKSYDGQSTLRKLDVRTTGVLDISASIYTDGLCKIVEPAKPAVYDCTPIFSPEEEAELGGC